MKTFLFEQNIGNVLISST